MVKRTIDWQPPTRQNKGRGYYRPEAIEELVAILRRDPDEKLTLNAYLDDDSGRQPEVWIKKEMSRRDALAHGLENAAGWYEVEYGLQGRPTRTQKLDRFYNIETTPKRLRNVLGVAPDYDLDKMPNYIRYSGLQAFAAKAAGRRAKAEGRKPLPTAGADALREAIAGLANLARWASLSARLERNRIKVEKELRKRTNEKLPAPHQGDPALREWVDMLGKVWKDLTHKRRGTGERSPFVAFVAKASIGLKPINRKTLTQDTARQLVRSVVGKKSTPTPL